MLGIGAPDPVGQGESVVAAKGPEDAGGGQIEAGNGGEGGEEKDAEQCHCAGVGAGGLLEDAGEGQRG